MHGIIHLMLTALPAVALAFPTKNGNSKHPAFFLAGDSTTAIDGGWGNGLLATLRNPAWGLNIGQSGATTVSYQQGGNWTNITAHVGAYATKYNTYVTISQFGHNDQKATSNVTFEEYQNNLIKFAEEVKSLGGTPLLVSSLSRRVFTSEHNATDSLHDQRLAAICAANVTGSPIIDLNAASLNYVNTIGEDAAHTYNLSPGDNTHLDAWGEVVFGRMVADLIVRALPRLDKWIVSNETLSNEIWNGIAA
ncbi:putative SGNH hydrolase-type esterase domain-containing protein [Seiridium cardinale]